MAVFPKKLSQNNDESKTHQEHAPPTAIPHIDAPSSTANSLHIPDEQPGQTQAPQTQTLEIPVEPPKSARLSSHEAKEEKEEKPAYLEELELDHDVEWMKQFIWIKMLLIVFGRWPITYSQDPHKRGYIFKFSCACPGFLIFIVTVVITLYGLIVSSINILSILMHDKVTDIQKRTTTQIIEQGLAERHTMILIIMLGSNGINTLTLLFIFVKRHQISETFTKWTRFLHFSKLRGTSRKYGYASIVVGNYMIVLTLYVVLTIFRVSATFIGGPTVVAIIFTRHFFPDNYLENFVGSSRHKLMHAMGLIIYLYVVTACNVYMYLFLWLLKSVDTAFLCWNMRMVGVVEAPSVKATPTTDTGTTSVEEDAKPQPPVNHPPNHPRLTYNSLYHDHIGLVRMLSWFNNIFAYTMEPYVLFVVIKIVYQMYLAALVMRSNGKPLNAANVGKYFIRKSDHIPPVLLTYENCFMLLTFFLACSWLEDTAYDSKITFITAAILMEMLCTGFKLYTMKLGYDILRKNCLLKGTVSDRQSFFFLSMFQSYTSTTKMAVCGGQYFCIDRYTILHVLSAIMSNFLVVYQFAPLFDMDTVEYEDLRKTMGKFLESFEGLPPNHTIPVADSFRNRISF